MDRNEGAVCLGLPRKITFFNLWIQFDGGVAIGKKHKFENAVAKLQPNQFLIVQRLPVARAMLDIDLCNIRLLISGVEFNARERANHWSV